MNSRLAKYLFNQEVLYLLPRNEDAVELKPLEPTVPPKEEVILEIDETPEKEPFKMRTKILLVVHTLGEEEQSFLAKVLGAVDLSFTKVDVLEMSKWPGIDFKELIYTFSVQAILFFGNEAGGEFLTRLPLKEYQPKKLKGIQFLKVDTLKEIIRNMANEKRQLWDALKLLFSV